MKIEIKINDESKIIDDSTSLENLVNQTLNDHKGLAVAINNSVVPKGEWERTALKPNDKVLFIRATQGG